MQTVNLMQLHRLLPKFWEQKLPLALWGRPSTGKTSAFRQFAQAKAKELGLEYSEDRFGPQFFTFKVIIPSQFDPVDFIGMMKLDEEKGVTYFNPVASFPREGQGIFFIDEISNADHSIIAPLQNLMLEARLENYRMPDTFWRVCAGNEVGDFSQVNELSLAFFRRLAHFKVEPELEEVLSYFMKKERDPRVIAYLKRFPEDLFPKVWDEKLLGLKANPFPYTWEMASVMIENETDLNKILYLASAWVGEAVGSRFLAFVKTTSKVNIKKLLKDPAAYLKELEEDPERPSLFYALVSILSSMWSKKEKSLTPQKIVEVLQSLPAEFATYFLKLLHAVTGRRVLLTRLPEFDSLIQKLSSYWFEDED